MLKRLVSASLVALAVVASTCTVALAAGVTGAAATTGSAVTATGSQLTLPQPPPCKGCAAPATSAQPAVAATPALYCAPSLQDLQCVVDELTHPCQQRCAVGLQLAVATARATRIESLPGDPCTRDWGQPVDTICHL